MSDLSVEDSLAVDLELVYQGTSIFAEIVEDFNHLRVLECLSKPHWEGVEL